MREDIKNMVEEGATLQETIDAIVEGPASAEEIDEISKEYAKEIQRFDGEDC